MTKKKPTEDLQKVFDFVPCSRISDLKPNPALYAQQHSGRSPFPGMQYEEGATNRGSQVQSPSEAL